MIDLLYIPLMQLPLIFVYPELHRQTFSVHTEFASAHRTVGEQIPPGVPSTNKQEDN